MTSKSLAKSSVFNIIYNLSNLLFPLITSVYVSRILLPEGIGQVSYAQSIASYFITLSVLGLPSYAVREMAKLRENQEEKDKLFYELFSINFISTTICSVIFFALIFMIEKFRSDWLLFMFCGIQILLNFINIDWLYKAEEEYIYIACRSIFIKLISLIMVFVFVKDRNDYIYYALISSFSAAGNYIFNIINARKYVNLDFKTIKLRKLNLKRHITPITILAVSSFLSTIYSKLDITMLGTITSNEVTGLYTNSHKIIEIVISLCTSISAIFLPRLSFYYKNDKREFKKILDLGFRVLCFTTIPATTGIFIMAPSIIEIMYGNSFIESAITIRLFAILIIIKSFGNLFCYQLVIATDNEKKRVPAYIISAIMNILLNAILIPKMYQNGAAIASVVSELIVNGVQLYAMVKIIDIPISWEAITQSIVSSFIMAVCVIFMMKLSLPLIIKSIISVLVGVCIYIIFNIIFKNKIMMEFLTKLQIKDKVIEC